MTPYGTYVFWLYFTPVIIGLTVLVFMGWFLNYRSLCFIIENVLGIHRIPKNASNVEELSSASSQQQSEIANNMKNNCCMRCMYTIPCCETTFNFLYERSPEYIDVYYHVEHHEGMKFHKKLRIGSFFSTVFILTILLTLIFESCILSNVTIKTSDWCPDYDAECFDIDSTAVAFKCIPYQKANFATNASTVWCFGWVFNQLSARKVFDSLGICGGLLGIISCVVPWIYHLSFYEDKPCKAFFWIWVPFVPIAALAVITFYNGIHKLGQPSMLTYISLLLVSILAFSAWFFAYGSARKRKQKVISASDSPHSTSTPPTTIQISF